MRKIWLVSFLVLMAGFFLTAAVPAEATEMVPRMTVDELKAQLHNPDLILLDVRSPADWERSDLKIAGALREEPRRFKEWAGKYPKEKNLVLYCE